MKLCMQAAYIHKIWDEFENQIDSIIFDGVIALCCKTIISNFVNTITLVNIGQFLMKFLYAGLYQ